VGFFKVMSYIHRPIMRRGAIAVSLLLLFVLLYQRHLVRYYLNGIGSGDALHYTYAKVLSDSLFGLDAEEEVTHYLNARIEPSAKVEYATLFPALKWRLRHPSATRFTTLVPLARTPEASPDYVETWRKEFVDSIRSAKPAYILLSRSHKWWPFVNAYADSVAHQIPGFDSELARDYELDTVIRGFELYRLRS
jgi:hypothetical protein